MSFLISKALGLFLLYFLGMGGPQKQHADQPRGLDFHSLWPPRGPDQSSQGPVIRTLCPSPNLNVPPEKRSQRAFRVRYEDYRDSWFSNLTSFGLHTPHPPATGRDGSPGEQPDERVSLPSVQRGRPPCRPSRKDGCIYS